MFSNVLKMKYFFIYFYKIKNNVFIANSLLHHKILIFIFNQCIQKVDFNASKMHVFNLILIFYGLNAGLEWA